MDSTEIEAAYRALLAAAESIGDPADLPAETRASVDWTLSHIALSDRILAEAVRDIRDGRAPVVDNRDAMDDTVIGELIASTSHRQRVELVRRNAATLAEAIRTIPEHAAATPVLVRLVGRKDQWLPWWDLARIRAAEHIPGHAARLVSAGSATG
ncbi:hypothetical protein [Sciscionella sediminilitoris]|uniref:hypothetical protein n=1 Tax=Sciscionella sediminilitoris TaxID=1445613 RepID=UPI0012E0E053|nr:hypothetical protein [Sciscionella sp. SE31]